MMEVKDLVQGRIYALQCPIHNFALKPFIFDCIKPHPKWLGIHNCHFLGIESPNLIYPLAVLYDGTNVLDYGTIPATLLTSLELELL